MAPSTVIVCKVNLGKNKSKINAKGEQRQEARGSFHTKEHRSNIISTKECCVGAVMSSPSRCRQPPSRRKHYPSSTYHTAV
ncbi:hypothetical protein MATL_G00174910 [Megalops atlanticus]|uniref:Uncharacterized protein n=1 Tax=Megalops atlanticus TaxID=7932 RepID=A0A9D3T8G9_MEGAT|nr:hypothetical protein MATL_G00174910 [Megalops atlanticus]